MIEDIRNHDALPTPQEKEWMSEDLLAMLLRAVVLAVVSLSVGISATVLLEHGRQAPAAAVAAPG